MKDILKNSLATVSMLTYFVVGIIQLAATFAGLTEWLEMHWLLALFCAGFVAYIPLLGTILGIFGAMIGWGWTFLSAAGLMIGPFLIPLVVVVLINWLESIEDK